MSVLSEAYLRSVELLLDEAVAVELVGGLEGEEAGHTDDHRAQDLVADVEVVVREAATLVGQDAVMGILGGILRYADAEGRPCSMLLKMK